MTNHFRTLGVKSNASEDDIKQAYRRLCQAMHPDKLLQATDDEKEQAAIRLQRVQDAYTVLSDPKKRAAFLKDLQNVMVSDPSAAMATLWDQYYP